MFKFVTFLACISIGLAAPGLLAEHHTLVEEPVLAKVGTVVHSSPSAVSHQSFTRVHNKAVITPVVAPVVKTTVHAVEPDVAVVKTVEPVVPVVKTVEAPVVHTYHAAPVVKTIHTPVVGHAVAHQSHVQIHSNAALVTPVVKSVVHTAPVVHSAPLVHAAPVYHATPLVHAAPVAHVYHH